MEQVGPTSHFSVEYTGTGKLFGLRGVFTNEKGIQMATLVVGVENPHRDAFVFDIPASCLPEIPDMGPTSQFIRDGHWHHYHPEGCAIVVTEEKRNNQRDGKILSVDKVIFGGKIIYEKQNSTLQSLTPEL